MYIHIQLKSGILNGDYKHNIIGVHKYTGFCGLSFFYFLLFWLVCYAHRLYHLLVKSGIWHHVTTQHQLPNKYIHTFTQMYITTISVGCKFMCMANITLYI